MREPNPPQQNWLPFSKGWLVQHCLALALPLQKHVTHVGRLPSADGASFGRSSADFSGEGNDVRMLENQNLSPLIQLSCEDCARRKPCALPPIRSAVICFGLYAFRLTQLSWSRVRIALDPPQAVLQPQTSSPEAPVGSSSEGRERGLLAGTQACQLLARRDSEAKLLMSNARSHTAKCGSKASAPC